MIVHQLESQHLKDYAYRGEGNANLVVSIPLTRTVLRFRKVESANEVSDGKTRILFEWKFFSKYISKLMGKFVTAPSIIKCHPRDFDNWNEKVEIFRPGHRKHKNTYEEYAIKLPDYAQLPEYLDVDVDTRKSTFCIEIKPKQGFVPEPDRHMQCCPYCINQFYKVAKKTISERSKYCPCDLFSGDRQRLCHAIDSLIESPQNNFIIFKNGNLVWGEGHSKDALDEILREWFGSSQVPRDNLRHLLCEALLREFTNDASQRITRNSNQVAENNVMNDTSLSRRIDASSGERLTSLSQSCRFPNGNLPEESVLGRLFSMQKLHSMSAEDVYEIYSKHSTILNEEIVYFSEPDDYKYNHNSITFFHILALRNYLLFSTARDCSVLLTFQQVKTNHVLELPAEQVITILDDNQTFVFNIGVTDLDPKSLNRIEKHHQRVVNSLKVARSQSNF